MAKALTVEQVAEYLQVSPYTVRAWIRQGKIPGRKIGRVYRVLDSDVEAVVGGVMSDPGKKHQGRLRAADALGMFAHVPFSTDDMAREKQAQIDDDERRQRKDFGG